MKKIMLLIIIAIIGLLVAGCENQDQTVEEKPFFGGNEGLVVEFEPLSIEEDGIYTIFDTEQFTLELNVKNKGEYDVAENTAQFRVYGISLNDYEGIPNGTLTNQDKIEKISEFNPNGGETNIVFTKNAKYRQTVTGFYEANIFAGIEYPYKTTVLVPKVCYKSDLTDNRVCDVEGSKDYAVSGAPITVTNVREEPAGKGIIALVFDVENVGNGDVAKLNEEFSNRYQKAGFEMVTDKDKWECTAGGQTNEIRFVDDKGTIRCRLNTPILDRDPSEKQIELALNYKYGTFVQETIKIKETVE